MPWDEIVKWFETVNMLECMKIISGIKTPERIDKTAKLMPYVKARLLAITETHEFDDIDPYAIPSEWRVKILAVSNDEPKKIAVLRAYKKFLNNQITNAKFKEVKK